MRWLVFGVLVVASLALGGCSVLQGVDKDEWVAANERILADVPVFPGAKFDSQSSNGVPSKGSIENGPPYSGYYTSRNFRLPSAARSGVVLAYYQRYARSDGWEGGRATQCQLTYTREEAFLGVRACGQRLRITVNHDVRP